MLSAENHTKSESVNNRKQYTILSLLVIPIILIMGLTPPAVCLGKTLGFELNANSTDIEGKMYSMIRLPKNHLVLSAGGIYSDHDYSVYDLNISVRDSILMPQLSIGLGFKGVMGDADKEGRDCDLAACNFLFFGEYDFRKHAVRLPISIAAYVAAAPAPLSFKDTKRYAEVNLSIYGHIVDNAAIVAGYRNIYMRFEKNEVETRKQDDAFFIGLKISF